MPASKLVTPAGANILIGGSRILTDNVWTQHFRGTTNGQRKGKGAYPDNFEPLGVTSGWLRCTDPQSRPGTYGADQENVDTGAGELFAAISCDWRDFGTAHVAASVKWSGLWADPDHTEATPLVCITPGTTRFGVGAWPTTFLGVTSVWLGYIGNPPENVSVLDTKTVSHTDGTPRTIELRTNAGGTAVTVWLDGSQLSMNTNGTSPITIASELQGSTLHGYAVDAHLVDPLTDVPTLDLIENFKVRALS